MAARKTKTPTEPATIRDPRAIKALAHPARLAVLEELNSVGQLTATECAAVAGMSASAMSYHLRALQKWGFVEPAEPSGDGRERPWRATSTRGWRIDSGSSPVAAAAESALVATSLDRLGAALSAWNEIEPNEARAWQDAATFSNATTWLTVEEARQLLESFQRITDAAHGRTLRAHPEGARRVRLALVVAPSAE